MTAPGQVADTASDGPEPDIANYQAASVASSAVGAAKDVASTAKQEAGNVVSEGMAQARKLTTEVKEQVEHQMTAGSGKLADTLRSLSTQLNTGDTSGLLGELMSEAGTRVRRLSEDLDRTGPQGLVTEVRNYARRSPTTFLLGMAVLGFAAGRVVKSVTSGKNRPESEASTSVGSRADEAESSLGALLVPSSLATYPNDVSYSNLESADITPLTTGHLDEAAVATPLSAQVRPQETP